MTVADLRAEVGYIAERLYGKATDDFILTLAYENDAKQAIKLLEKIVKCLDQIALKDKIVQKTFELECLKKELKKLQEDER